MPNSLQALYEGGVTTEKQKLVAFWYRNDYASQAHSWEPR